MECFCCANRVLERAQPLLYWFLLEGKYLLKRTFFAIREIWFLLISWAFTRIIIWGEKSKVNCQSGTAKIWDWAWTPWNPAKSDWTVYSSSEIKNEYQAGNSITITSLHLSAYYCSAPFIHSLFTLYSMFLHTAMHLAGTTGTHNTMIWHTIRL